MSKHPEQDTLDDVLNAYLDVAPTPSAEDLAVWVQKYPQYREELTEFTVARSLMLHLPANSDPLDETALFTRGVSVMRTVLQREREKQAAEQPPPASLLEEGQRQGMNIHKLAELTGLSAALWRKLDRRLIRPASVPRQLVERIADMFHNPVAVVQRYLSQPPMLSPSALYRAKATPTLGEQEDFFEAVRNDLSLSDEQRQRWLAVQHATSLGRDELSQ